MSDIGIQIIGDRILAIPIKVEKKGIILIEDEKPREDIVKVVAVSTTSPVKVGDRVLISGAWHQKINVNEQDLMVVFNQDILGVMSEKV